MFSCLHLKTTFQLRTLSSHQCFMCQTLRQRIQDEYREVVERRVITGLKIQSS